MQRPRFGSALEVLESRIAPAAGVLPVVLLDGPLGFQLSGVAVGDRAGWSVSDAGDVNGDGFGDVVVGADRADNGDFSTGSAYVVFGKASGFAATLDLATLDGENGFRIDGAGSSDDAGKLVSAAGDLNNDGFGDLLIGSAGDGSLHVVFGKGTAFTPVVSLASLGSGGVKITGTGIATSVSYGAPGAPAGDVNDDGIDDLIIGAAFANSTGDTFVVYGKAGAFPTSINLDTLASADGFRIHGQLSVTRTGFAVSSAGDFNRDGVDDVLIGSRNANKAYIVFGQAGGFNETVYLSALTPSTGWILHGEFAETTFGFGGNLGLSVDAAGDVNADGYADIILGDSEGDPNNSSSAAFFNSGAAYVVFGRPNGTNVNLLVESLDGTTGFKIHGSAARDEAGTSVAGVGDVNGDTFDDVLVSVPGTGNSYVVFGKTEFAGTLQLSAFGAADGVRIASEGGSLFGNSVSGAGDVNDDGFTDLIIGQPHQDTKVAGTGAAYVIFGAANLGADQTRADLVTIAKNGRSATFTDVDGDLVKVAVSKGKLKPENLLLRPEGVGAQLMMVDFAGDQTFAGTQLTISAKQQNIDGDPEKEGDRMVNVGSIRAVNLDLGAVKIAGDLGQVDAGLLETGGKPIKSALSSLKVASIGALGASSQAVGADLPFRSEFAGKVNQLMVSGNVSGALFSMGGATDFSSVKIGGDFRAGDGPSGILTQGKIGVVSIGGDFASDDATNPIVISAFGVLDVTKSSAAITIKSITVGRDVLNAQILAGYQLGTNPAGPDASIGSVLVKRDWIASSLVAGVWDITGDGFGRNDAAIQDFSPDAVLATIASVTIKGAAIGSPEPGDHFGITARVIGKATISGSKLDLGDSVDRLLDQANGDFRLVEIAP